MNRIHVLTCSSAFSRSVVRCDADAEDTALPDGPADPMVNDRIGRSMTAEESSKSSSSFSSSERGIVCSGD